MLAISHRSRLGKSTALPAWAPSFVTAGVPIPTSPPGASPGSLATVPTVTTVQPGSSVFPSTADTPTATATPGFQPGFPNAPAPSKAWLPWAIGGGILAAVGAAVVVFLHR